MRTYFQWKWMLKRRLTAPFKTRVITFEHTRIRVRSFPPLFEYERVESIAEKGSRGGLVDLSGCSEYVIYETLELKCGTKLKCGGRTLVIGNMELGVVR